MAAILASGIERHLNDDGGDKGPFRKTTTTTISVSWKGSHPQATMVLDTRLDTEEGA
jgi:hypothetical protein